MYADEYVARLFVLAVVFIAIISLLWACFSAELRKIDEAEDDAKFADKRRNKTFLEIPLITFLGYCEVCQKKSATHIGDSRREGDGFISVCEDCNPSFKNLQPIIVSAMTSGLA